MFAKIISGLLNLGVAASLACVLTASKARALDYEVQSTVSSASDLADYRVTVRAQEPIYAALIRGDRILQDRYVSRPAAPFTFTAVEPCNADGCVEVRVIPAARYGALSGEKP